MGTRSAVNINNIKIGILHWKLNPCICY